MNLFAYLDLNNPMVAWEVAIGRMKSADICYNDKKFELSIWEYDLIRNYTKYGANQKFINELQLEYIRKTKYMNYVSRMKCLYFFETKNDAVFALDHWGIDINEEFISEVELKINKITKVDSEWITNFIDSDVNNEWMDYYWQEYTYKNKPLYELLVDGFGIIKNERLCRLAHKKIYETWPYSTRLLAIAMCGFQIKNIDNIAKVIPGIYTSNGKIKGSYFIDISDLDKYKKELIEAMKYAQSINDFPPVVLPPDKNVAFILPDLRYLEIDFENSYIATLLQKVHKK
jgi:hypothetical protein